MHRTTHESSHSSALPGTLLQAQKIKTIPLAAASATMSWAGYFVNQAKRRARETMYGKKAVATRAMLSIPVVTRA